MRLPGPHGLTDTEAGKTYRFFVGTQVLPAQYRAIETPFGAHEAACVIAPPPAAPTFVEIANDVAVDRSRDVRSRLCPPSGSIGYWSSRNITRQANVGQICFITKNESNSHQRVGPISGAGPAYRDSFRFVCRTRSLTQLILMMPVSCLQLADKLYNQLDHVC